MESAQVNRGLSTYIEELGLVHIQCSGEHGSCTVNRGLSRGARSGAYAVLR